MLIKFTEDFANNWKAGDIVEAKYLEKGEVLVDGVAKIDINLLLLHCKIISESEEVWNIKLIIYCRLYSYILTNYLHVKLVILLWIFG